MRTPRIYTGQQLRPDTELELESGPSQHLGSALRMQAGDAIVLFDGRGGEYAAIITQAGKRRVSVAVGSHVPHELESPLQVTLGIAMSRGDRMDWVVQKATELGANAIVPLATSRTEVKLKGDRALKKRAHWQQVAISACEQCGRNRLPAVAAPTPLQDWIQQCDAELKLVLHHRAQALPAKHNTPQHVALLVGPEGGLSEEEITAAEKCGFISLQLGPRVLRTETAPIAALSVLQTRWGDMRVD